LQSPDGDATALKLSALSFCIALIALAASEILSKRAQALTGR
jgi:hypothetical protein